MAGIACEADTDDDETGIFGVYQVLLGSGTVVGGIGFIHPPENGEVEVGYGLARPPGGRDSPRRRWRRWSIWPRSTVPTGSSR